MVDAKLRARSGGVVRADSETLVCEGFVSYQYSHDFLCCDLKLNVRIAKRLTFFFIIH